MKGKVLPSTEIQPNTSATQRSYIPRQTTLTGRTDRLRKDGPKIRVSPSPKRRSRAIRAIVTVITLGVIADAGLPEERDAEGVVEDIRISIRSFIDAEIGCRGPDVRLACDWREGTLPE